MTNNQLFLVRQLNQHNFDYEVSNYPAIKSTVFRIKSKNQTLFGNNATIAFYGPNDMDLMTINDIRFAANSKTDFTDVINATLHNLDHKYNY